MPLMPPPAASPCRFVNLPDRYGRTALHMVAWSGQLRAAYAVLQAGATLSTQTKADCLESDLPCNIGTSPLHVAAFKGALEMVLLLISTWVRASQAGQRDTQDPRAMVDGYGNTAAALATSRRGDQVLQQVGRCACCAALLCRPRCCSWWAAGLAARHCCAGLMGAACVWMI
jgi:hypothetical protein